MDSTSTSINWTDLTSQLSSFAPLLQFICTFLGVFMVMSSLVQIGLAGRRGGTGYMVHVVGIFVGVALLNIQQFIDALSQTAFRQNADTLLGYTPPTGIADAQEIGFLVIMVHIVGYWAVVKGFREMGSSWQGEGEWGKGVTHIIGGIFAINLVTFMHAVGNTVGGSVNTMVTNIFG